MTREQQLEVLQAARRKLARQWGQGNFSQRDEGHECIWTAIDHECARRFDQGITRRDAIRIIEFMDFVNLQAAFNWNDTKGRTIEEVLARLDEAIEDTAALV